MTTMGGGQEDMLAKPDNLEVTKGAPSPSRDGELLQPDHGAESSNSLSTSSNPPASSTSLSSFRSLIATHTVSGNIKLSPADSTSTCLFYVRHGSFRRNGPSVAICAETKNGPVLGSLKLGWGRDNTFGVGDPSEDANISWLNLRWVSPRKHAVYEFEYGMGEDRRLFVWQTTRQRMLSDQPDLELREKSAAGDMGEVLAVFNCTQGMNWKKCGQFWLSPHFRTVGETAWSGNNSGEWSEMEVLVLLSALGIIESSKRRMGTGNS